MKVNLCTLCICFILPYLRIWNQLYFIVWSLKKANRIMIIEPRYVHCTTGKVMSFEHNCKCELFASVLSCIRFVNPTSVWKIVNMQRLFFDYFHNAQNESMQDRDSVCLTVLYLFSWRLFFAYKTDLKFDWLNKLHL